MDLSQITRIVELMSKHDLTEIDIKSEELALTIKRERKKDEQQAQPSIMMMPQAAAPAPATAPAPAAAPAAAEEAAEPAEDLPCIESPLVGTFYAAPSPDAGPFVKVGDTVSADTVVCIVEAMKVMNEIKAEKSGVIKKILVENAQPVEFGQPLFQIEPA